jgi:hypothetical protein
MKGVPLARVQVLSIAGETGGPRVRKGRVIDHEIEAVACCSPHWCKDQPAGFQVERVLPAFGHRTSSGMSVGVFYRRAFGGGGGWKMRGTAYLIAFPGQCRPGPRHEAPLTFVTTWLRYW